MSILVNTKAMASAGTMDGPSIVATIQGQLNEAQSHNTQGPHLVPDTLKKKNEKKWSC